jgi:hypothetical protein
VRRTRAMLRSFVPSGSSALPTRRSSGSRCAHRCAPRAGTAGDRLRREEACGRRDCSRGCRRTIAVAAAIHHPALQRVTRTGVPAAASAGPSSTSLNAGPGRARRHGAGA